MQDNASIPPTIEEIGARWSKSTPGPWVHDASYFIRPDEMAPGFAQVNAAAKGKPSAIVALTFERWPRWGEDEVREPDWEQAHNNAIAIAAAPTDVAALLADNARLRAEVARLEAIAAVVLPKP